MIIDKILYYLVALGITVIIIFSIVYMVPIYARYSFIPAEEIINLYFYLPQRFDIFFYKTEKVPYLDIFYLNVFPYGRSSFWDYGFWENYIFNSSYDVYTVNMSYSDGTIQYERIKYRVTLREGIYKSFVWIYNSNRDSLYLESHKFMSCSKCLTEFPENYVFSCFITRDTHSAGIICDIIGIYVSEVE